MKFSQKLAAAIVLPVCMALSAGGTWSIHRNFFRSLDMATQAHTAAQISQRYELEMNLGQAENADPTELFSQLMQYADQQRQMGKEENWFAVMGENGSVLYSNIPQTIPYRSQRDAASAAEQTVLYATGAGRQYQLLGTQMRGLSRPLWLVNVYDMSPQFAERDRQIRQHLTLEVVVLLLAAGAAAVVSHCMTEPLRQLETASRKLARGDLTARTQIESGDELERLGNTFNGMAQAVCEQMQALQEESMRQKRFVGAFNHELKTPMTAIFGYANLLRSGEQPSEKRHRAADYIYHESLRLENLSRELLLLLGLEKGGVEMKPVSLATVKGELFRSLPELEKRLLWQCEETTVQANKELLVTLLRNLVVNAAVADTTGKSIRIWSQDSKGKVRIGVTDCGPGIPEEEVARIKEPFYRIDKSRSREAGGNGLGLAICEQIAQAHNTDLQIESRLGQGTTLSIILQEVQG